MDPEAVRFMTFIVRVRQDATGRLPRASLRRYPTPSCPPVRRASDVVPTVWIARDALDMEPLLCLSRHHRLQ